MLVSSSIHPRDRYRTSLRCNNFRQDAAASNHPPRLRSCGPLLLLLLLLLDKPSKIEISSHSNNLIAVAVAAIFMAAATFLTSFVDDASAVLQ